MHLYIFDRPPKITGVMRRYLYQLPGLNIGTGEAEISHILTTIKRDKPEIVLLDFELRGGSAIDVLQHFGPRPHAPVFIVMISLPIARYREAAMEAGADYCIYKNYNVRDLRNIVREIAKKLGMGN